MADQFGRRVSLVVSGATTQTDLSELRFTFNIKQADIQTPNNGIIRIFNLSDTTAQAIEKEGARVVLQAGYVGEAQFAVIFDGTIKQVRRGRESSIDSYLDILAADGDVGLNNAIVAASIAAGSSPADRFAVAAGTLTDYGVAMGYLAPMGEAKLPRGKVMYGMSRDQLRTLAASEGVTYSVQNGKLQTVPLQGFKPGEAVVVNAETGMIGWPEQTENGVVVRTLLNPLLSVGSKLKIDNASILLALQNPSLQGQLDYEVLKATVPLDADGVYRIYVIEHTGDTRGQEWYSDIICLTVDGTVPMGLAARGQA